MPEFFLKMNMTIFLSKLYLLIKINNLYVIWLSDTDIISHSLKEKASYIGCCFIYG